MIQDNAGFTFLHSIEEVELNIEDGRRQSALRILILIFILIVRFYYFLNSYFVFVIVVES